MSKEKLLEKVKQLYEDFKNKPGHVSQEDARLFNLILAETKKISDDPILKVIQEPSDRTRYFDLIASVGQLKTLLTDEPFVGII